MKLFRNITVTVALVFGLFMSHNSLAAPLVAAGDSTALNVKDADGTSKTPLDQFQGSDKDVETTRQIRQALMDDESLSTNARNVKVITLRNKVTIRGAVNSNDELNRVVSLAKAKAPQNSQIVQDLNVVK
jgi:hyperosmotically inducible periplasmic protein